MNTKFIYVGMAALISVAVAVVSLQKEDLTDELLRENVEALADDEYGHNIRCWSFGSLDCPLNGTKVKYIMGDL